MLNASTLGGNVREITATTYNTLESVPPGLYWFSSSNVPSWVPTGYSTHGILEVKGTVSQVTGSKVAWLRNPTGSLLYTTEQLAGMNNFSSWVLVYTNGMLTNSSILSPLASALGVINYKGTISSDDLNNYTSSGYWWGLTGNTNTPIANLDNFILEVIAMGTTNAHLLQRISFVVSNTNTAKVYQRMGNATGGVLTWSDWKEL